MISEIHCEKCNGPVRWTVFKGSDWSYGFTYKYYCDRHKPEGEAEGVLR